MSAKVDRDTAILQAEYEIGQDGPVLTGLRAVPCVTAGRGDYRPSELTEAADRQRVFKKLIYPKEVGGMQNLPPSFLETGFVKIENGLPVP